MGVVNTQYTFAANDVITSTKMNDIIDQTTVDGSAILGNTLEVAGGKLKVRAQGITSNELAANAVTNTQIANGAVTPAKLSTGAPNWDTIGNLNVNNGLYVTTGAAINGGVSIGGNLGVDGVVTCEAVYFGDDAGLLYDSGVGDISLRYGVAGSEKYSTFNSSGQLTVGGAIVSTTGTIRAQGYGGTANAGVVYFGTGDNYVYHNGSNFEFKFGAGVSATLSSAGTIWTSGNDGAGSGLDADLLDGLQPSSLNAANTIVKRDGNGDSGFRSIAADHEIISYSGRIKSEGYGGFPERGVIFLGTNESGYVYNNGSTLEFRSPTGGLSYLTSSGTIWTSGNDGAGSGLDADLLDGLQPTPAATVSTIVSRNQNGDSSFRNIYCTNIDASYAGFTGLGVTNLISGTTSGNIKQSGGANQLNNVVYMGWRADNTLGVQVDSTSFENNWPINITGTATTANTVTDGAITASKLSGAQTGAAPVYGARAYANFNCNGVAIGGLALKGSSGNIGNITKLAVGKYNIAFSTAMPSSGYAIIGTCNNNTTGAAGVSGVIVPYQQAAGDVNVSISDVNSSVLYDPQWCNIVVFA